MDFTPGAGMRQADIAISRHSPHSYRRAGMHVSDADCTEAADILTELHGREWMSGIARFRASVPYFPHAGPKQALRRMTKTEALEQAYIQVNPAERVWCIAVDVDHPRALGCWLGLGLPPSLLVLSERGTGHLIYALRDPIFPDDSHATQAYLKRATRLLTMVLGGDTAYSGYAVKNPCSAAHAATYATGCAYGLAEIVDACERVLGPFAVEPEAPTVEVTDGTTRRDQVWNRLRVWAYDHVRFFEDGDAFREAVIEQARERLPTISRALPWHKVKDVCRRVCRWVWAHRDRWEHGYNARKTRAPVLDLPDDMPTAERQAAGGRHAAATKRARTTEAITAAIQWLKGQGMVVTQAAVAGLIGVSRSTLTRYRDLFRSVLSGESSKEISDQSTTLEMHQGDFPDLGSDGSACPVTAPLQPCHLPADCLSVPRLTGLRFWAPICNNETEVPRATGTVRQLISQAIAESGASTPMDPGRSRPTHSHGYGPGHETRVCGDSTRLPAIGAGVWHLANAARADHRGWRQNVVGYQSSDRPHHRDRPEGLECRSGDVAPARVFRHAELADGTGWHGAGAIIARALLNVNDGGRFTRLMKGDR